MSLKQKKSIGLRKNNLQLIKQENEFYFFEIKTLKKGTTITRTIKIKTTKDLINIANTETPKNIVFYIDKHLSDSNIWEINETTDYLKLFNDTRHIVSNIPNTQKTPEPQTSFQTTDTTKPQEKPIISKEIKPTPKNYENKSIKTSQNNLEIEIKLLNKELEISKRENELFKKELDLSKKEIEILKSEIDIQSKTINSCRTNTNITNQLNCENNQKSIISQTKPNYFSTPKYRHWKSRGFVLIKIFVKKPKVTILQNEKNQKIFELITKTKKQTRTIRVETKLDIYKEGILDFYIHDSFLNQENWKISDQKNQISFNPI